MNGLCSMSSLALCFYSYYLYIFSFDCSHRVLTHRGNVILTFAHFSMTNRFGWITIVAFFAVVAMTARCCMSTIQAYSTGYTARHLIQFHIETTSSRVSITVASCKRYKKKIHSYIYIQSKSNRKSVVSTPKYDWYYIFYIRDRVKTSKVPLIYFHSTLQDECALTCTPHTHTQRQTHFVGPCAYERTKRQMD